MYFFKVIKKVNLYLIHLKFATFQTVWLPIEPIFQFFLNKEKIYKQIHRWIWSADLVVVVLGVWWFWSQIPSKTRGQYSAYWSCLYSNQNRYPKISRSFWLCSLLGSDLYCIYLLTCARMRYTKATFLIPEFSVT